MLNDENVKFQKFPIISKPGTYIIHKRGSKSSLDRMNKHIIYCESGLAEQKIYDFSQHILSIEKPKKLTTKAKTIGHSLHQTSTVMYKEVGEQRSTNASETITQKQIEFIPSVGKYALALRYFYFLRGFSKAFC